MSPEQQAEGMANLDEMHAGMILLCARDWGRYRQLLAFEDTPYARTYHLTYAEAADYDYLECALITLRRNIGYLDDPLGSTEAPVPATPDPRPRRKGKSKARAPTAWERIL